jgi:cysteine-rich repeat protein
MVLFGASVGSRVVCLVGLLSVVAIAACGGAGNTLTAAPDASLESGASDAGGGTAEGGTSEDSGAAEDGGTCGNGVVEGAEECDDGQQNGTAGDPCTHSCTWVCIQGDPTRGDPACNTSSNACAGTATCQANHTCAAGTPADAGTSCGTGLICNGGLCAQAVCGDGIVTSPEECDDGSNNGSPTDGCTINCTFVCVSGDPTRDCTPSDPCQGQGTCNDATHICTPGTPEPDGTICAGEQLDGGITDAGPDAGGIEVCKSSVCVPGYCGDGVVEPGEQCDLGAGNGTGTGCELNCTFSCKKAPNSCTTTDICSGSNSCVTVFDGGGQKCELGAPPDAGTSCGGDAGTGTCEAGLCHSSLCGNGVVDPGEQCDFGAGNNLTGSGCEPDCQFSCQTDPDTCPHDNLCGPSPTTCQVDTGPNHTGGQKCQAATALPACGDCAPTGVCVDGGCATSVCGDGCIDPRIGSTCSPPNTPTCDSQCHTIVPAVCGNSIRETGEQCDDGNTTNLDGCDSKCQFEQDHRADSVTFEFSTDTFCTHNALGESIGSVAQSQLAGSLESAVVDGTTNIQFKFMGIKDLTGTAQAQSTGLALGAISGTPAAAPAGETYDGGADLDWWYTTAASTIDSSRNPLSQLPASFAAKVLTATGSIVITISIGGQPANLNLSGANIQADIGGVTLPKESTETPGHLATEHLDPTLQSFSTMNNGRLCGNISAASLASVAVPALLQPGGSGACTNQSYTTAAGNSLLDVLVGGCSTLAGFITIISPTQPDQINAGVPAAGAGPAYTLTTTGTKVTGCKDHTGAVVDFTTCLNAAAYSTYFQFTSDRVIMK